MKNILYSILITLTITLTFTTNTLAQDYTTISLPEGAKARLGKGSINEIKYSPDGTKLAVGGSIGVWIYDAQTGEELDLLSGHTGWVSSISFSPDGSTIVSGSSDDTIRMWNADTGRHIRTLSGHTDTVYSVSFSPDGGTIASGSDDSTIRMWNADTGRHIRTLSGHTRSVYSVSFSPDGGTIASASFDSTIRMWEADTGTHIRTLSGHRSWVSSVSFSPDGGTIASGSDDRTIRMWNADTGRHIRTLSGHTGSVSSVSFSPDGSTIASGSDDTTIRMWNADTGRHIRTLSGHTHWGQVNSVSFSPDGSTLASGSSDSTIRLWEADTGTHIRTISGHTGWVEIVSFSPDGSTIASASSNGPVRLRDVKTGTEKKVLWQPGSVSSVAFSPNGEIIACGSYESTVNGDVVQLELWDVNTGTPLGTLKAYIIGYVNSVAFSPDGKTLATGSSGSFEDEQLISGSITEGKTLCVWDVATGIKKQEFKGHSDSVNSVAFSPDGKTLASGSYDDTIRLWDANSGEHIQTLTRHTDDINSIAFSPDGSTLASGSSDGTIRLWEADTGRHIRTISGFTGWVEIVSFSPDGSTLASVSSDGTVLLWELTRTEQEKPVIVSFRLENGKEVTLYRENEDTLVYTIGLPDEAPELEYRGPILESVSANNMLWGEGIESLSALSSELMTGKELWTTLNGEPDIIAEAISKAANSDESHGFISVSASTGSISQSAYIFRTSGWEYVVSYTEGRPINVPEEELDDYKSYSLTALAPDGKMLRLHSATNATDSISHDTVPSPANSKQFTLSRLRFSVGVLGVRINEASVNIQDGIGVEGGVSYDFNRFAVIADYRLAMSLKGFEAETEAETELDFSPLWIFQSGSLGARVYLIQKGFSPYIGGGVSVIWMSRKLILIDEDKLGPGIYGVIGIDTGRFSKSGLKLELRIDKPFSTFENEVSVLDELIDIEWDQKTFTPVSLGIYYSKQF